MLLAALAIGGIFELAAGVFLVAADDPHMAFMLAITGVAMGTMAAILVHAMDTAEVHAHLPSWRPVRASKPAAHAPEGVHMPAPSILPLVVCAGAAVLFFGLAVNLSFLALGTLVFGVALAGWLLDSRREWRAVANARDGHVVNPTPLRPSRLLVDVALIAFFSLALGQSGVFAAGAKGPVGPVADPRHPELVASGVKFNLGVLKIQAGEAVTLKFTNNDAGVPHNVAVRVKGASGDPVFAGEQFAGVATEEYELPALDANASYEFFCQLHANMKGAIELVP